MVALPLAASRRKAFRHPHRFSLYWLYLLSRHHSLAQKRQNTQDSILTTSMTSNLGAVVLQRQDLDVERGGFA